MNKVSYILIFILIAFSLAKAQNNDRSNIQMLTLYQVIDLVREQSQSALQAKTRRENRYWQYRTYLSDYKPQLRLEGAFPEYTRRFTPITQEDGTIEFQLVNNNNSNLNLSLFQSVGTLGTRLYANTELQRFDDLERDFTRYSGTPVSVGFYQPLFSFNELAWNRKIEPLRYEESQKEYYEDLEQMSVTAVRLFFNLLLAQIDMEIALNNRANNDTIFKIAQGRYNLGKIAENELLQLELNLMNSRQAVAQAELDLATFAYRLKSYIGIPGTQRIELILPGEIPQFDVPVDKALQQALKNRPAAVEFKRSMLEAERDVAQARGNTGLNAAMVGEIGLTSRGNSFDQLYEEPQDHQRVQVEFDIPVLDWGRTKSRRMTAEANKQLVEYTIAQDKVNFEEEIFTQVRLFEMLRNQLEITSVASDIGQKSYDISKNRFLIGKISITDLNDALEKKDNARRSYIQSLREFWESYYELRSLTLYDFEKDRILLLESQN